MCIRDRSIPTLSEDEKSSLKTKLRNSCEKYGNIKIPFKQQEIIKNLMNKDDIIIMRQDKGRGVVIIDKNKYTEKCLSMLESDQFKKLSNDPTTTTERKTQNLLRKIKKNLSTKLYKKLYPTGSRPGQFYGLAKIHKLKDGQGIEHLPLRPIISNIGTATYEIAKHLAKLLSPLSQSDYTLSNTDGLITTLKTAQIPEDCEIVSFDVKSLFTNVPLKKTIEIILRKVYDENLIQTEIPRKEMEELLLICTQNVHFTFNGSVYQQIDGVAMGSPLGPVIAGIFMVELENTIVPTLRDSLLFWKRYVDDTLCFVKKGSRDFVMSTLNNFHGNIQFTYEEETNNMISFLDVLLIRQPDNSFDRAVFRKGTHTDLYINWEAFAPESWKISTLKMLVKRAYKICSKDYFLEMELDHLKKTFIEVNKFPHSVVKRVLRQVAIEQNQTNTTQTIEDETSVQPDQKVVITTLPYAGKKGEDIVKEIKKHLKKYKEHNLSTRISFKAKRLSSCFNLKDKIAKKHEHNVVYEVKCPDCDHMYIGECGRRIHERFKDHAGKDKNSHVFKHTLNSGHSEITMNDVKIINKNFKNYYKRKISEAIYIKQRKPFLNIQDKSVPLKLLD